MKNNIKKAQGDPEYCGYLFAYFIGDTIPEESVHFALSSDGYTYKALNNNKAVIDSADISLTGGVRDPHVCRGVDGQSYYMALTDMTSCKGWNSNRGLVLLKSTDLIAWTASIIDIQKTYSNQEDLLRVWAPQTIYDAEAEKYMVYWSMKHGNGPDIIYYAYANADFTSFENPPEVLFYPEDKKSCIDGDIIYHNGLYHLFYKTEDHGNGIKKAVTKSLTSGNWQEFDDYKQQTTSKVEGSCAFKLINEDKYILMYDVYTSGRYEFTISDDLDTFKKIDDEISMDFTPRHGSMIPVTKDEWNRLQKKWGTFKE